MLVRRIQFTYSTAYGGAIYVTGDVDTDLYAGRAMSNVANVNGGFLVTSRNVLVNFQWASGWDYLHIGVEGFNNSAMQNGGGIYMSSNDEFARFSGSGGNFHDNFIGTGYITRIFIEIPKQPTNGTKYLL